MGDHTRVVQFHGIPSFAIGTFKREVVHRLPEHRSNPYPNCTGITTKDHKATQNLSSGPELVKHLPQPQTQKRIPCATLFSEVDLLRVEMPPMKLKYRRAVRADSPWRTLTESTLSNLSTNQDKSPYSNVQMTSLKADVIARLSHTSSCGRAARESRRNCEQAVSTSRGHESIDPNRELVR